MSRPWMPLYVADYLADTAHLSAAESGAYLHLIMHYWQKGGLPTDAKHLARIAKMTPDEWEEHCSSIAAFFDDDWRHKRIDRELENTRANYRRRLEFLKSVDDRRPPPIEWVDIRSRIFEHDDYTCRYCGKHGGNLECDHVVPISRNGSNDDSNLVTACKSCNRAKGARTGAEWFQ